MGYIGLAKMLKASQFYMVLPIIFTVSLYYLNYLYTILQIIPFSRRNSILDIFCLSPALEDEMLKVKRLNNSTLPLIFDRGVFQRKILENL